MAEFNPYEAPRADFAPVSRPDSGASLWQDGEILIARSEAEFPDRCIKCDAPAEGYRFKRTLRWHPQGYYFLLMFNILIYAIVASVVSKKGKVAAGLCAEHRARRRNGILVGWGLAVLGIVLLIVGIAQESPALMIAGPITLLAGIIYGIVRSRVLVPQQIEKDIIRLQKVDRAFLAALPRWYP